MRVKDVALIAIFAALLFAQEELLSFLPNVQLTIFLIVLYSKVLGFKKTSIIVIIHTILDSLFMGSLNLAYFPFMLAGWLFIPIIISTILKNTENQLILALFGIIASFVYSWMFVIPSVLITKVDLLAYLSADLLFEVVLAATSFVSILWLYKPLSKALQQLFKKNEEKQIL